jgi:hypothetical protein
MKFKAEGGRRTTISPFSPSPFLPVSPSDLCPSVCICGNKNFLPPSAFSLDHHGCVATGRDFRIASTAA